MTDEPDWAAVAGIIREIGAECGRIRHYGCGRLVCSSGGTPWGPCWECARLLNERWQWSVQVAMERLRLDIDTAEAAVRFLRSIEMTDSRSAGEALRRCIEQPAKPVTNRSATSGGTMGILPLTRRTVLERLHLVTKWPSVNEGGIAAIREWIDNQPHARLVIVDVLAMFKAITKGKDQTLYEAD